MSFLAHAAAHGLRIRELLADGRWHRCPTEDKPKKKNGAYVLDDRGGCVINFATMVQGSIWRPDGTAERVDRQALRRMMRQSAEQERRRHEEARHLAEDMLKRAVLNKHPYLAAKGFPEEVGLVLDDELLIPMREFRLYKQVNSLQRIAADGSKLFLPGGKAKGSVFFIGPFLARERWLCEGYATGLSIRAASRTLYREAQVVICFSAGNLAHIGRIAKELRPEAFVMADNDKSGAGAKAAEETGLPWRMPPVEGFDANDFHREFGVHALAGLMRDLRTGERTASG